MLAENGGNAKTAFAEACMANLGYNPSEDSDADTVMMFLDHNDMQAVSQPGDPHREVIKRHLAALQKFSDEEILAAQEHMSGETPDEQDADSESGDESEGLDTRMEEAEEDSEDDIPLHQLARNYQPAQHQSTQSGPGIVRMVKRPKKPKSEPTLEF